MSPNAPSPQPYCRPNFSTTLRKGRKRESGIAIITVLAVLLLMTVLILAFFNMARSELTDSRNYSEMVRNRQLTDVVTNVVIAQLRTASQSSQSNASLRFTSVVQPGAVTVFHNDGSNGSDFASMAFAKYKLYSSHEMVADGDDKLVRDVPTSWDAEPTRFVDLNEPIYNSTKDRLYFPIIDPRGYAEATEPGQLSTANIEGFRYSDTNSMNRAVNGVVGPSNGEHLQRLPMPVEWLYMLQDGTLGHLDTTGVFQSPADGGTPSEQNPIVARIAFWTDDESAKININVAAEGAHHDEPRADSQAERDYAKYPPVRNEVFRYAGHPSTTSVSTFLYPGIGANYNGARPFLTNDQYQRILALTPKAEFYVNGSGIGDRHANVSADLEANGLSPFLPDDNHLYATPDEYIFAGGADIGGDPNAEFRPLNEVFGRSNDIRRRLEYARHSITTHNSSPEMTAFGTPRVCLWPMHSPRAIETGSGQTYYDRLISYATTLGDRRYYYQKHNATSRHWENYVSANGENLQLLDDYLMHLAAARVPGYGSSFARKYGVGRFSDGRSIMTQIWDSMRNTNLRDPLLPTDQCYAAGFSSTVGTDRTPVRIGRGQIAGSCLCGGGTPHRSVWWQAWNKFPKGQGRLYTLSEVALVFYCRAINPPSGEGFGSNFEALSAGEKLIEAALVLETFSVGHGFTSITPNSRMLVTGGVRNDGTPILELPEYKIDDQPLPPMGNKAVDARWDSSEDYVNKRPWGGYGGIRLFSGNLDRSSPGQPLVDNPNVDGLVWETQFTRTGAQEVITNGVVVDANAQTMQFQGSDQPLHIILYDQRGSGGQGVGNLVQVFHVAFDNPENPGTPMQIPVPNIEQNEPSTWTWNERIRKAGKNPEVMIRPGDVTRSMVVAHGDIRLVSGQRVVQKHVWTPHPKFNDPTARHAHALVAADGTKFHGYDMNHRGYVEGADYPADKLPDFVIDPADHEKFLPQHTQQARNYSYSVDPGETGDWNTGMGAHLDGPYVTRAEDGNQRGLPGSRFLGGTPYFDNLSEDDDTNPAFFAPNHTMPSAGLLGSIPTGVQSEIPWRTLLFRPDPQHFGSGNNPQKGNLPDHLYMDFFWMPVVEPFPISTPLSTIGKNNLNYQIVPFDYIKRATAIHAVMKSERMLAVPTKEGQNYKSPGGDDYRHPINIPATLEQFEDRFAKGELFRSASEICEVYLVPRTPSAPDSLDPPVDGDYPQMRRFWKDHQLTADNAKERSYTNLYPRLTTKSNVFQTHMIVETVRKARSVAHDRFDPNRDTISGRWRGSAIIERDIDPNNRNIPDYFGDASFSQPSLEEFYQYRVLRVKQFNP